jgi:4-alpha-glucanotransferase
MPITSLPSKYGIGSFSKSAYRFIDQLKLAGQKYWQLLPLGPTSYGDSPYQSFSTFAGNPYFIDLEALIEQGYLTKEECESYNFGEMQRTIDYQKIYLSRFKLLKVAYNRSHINENEAFHQFIKKNAYWLEDYALYMAIKTHFSSVNWSEWDTDIRMRQPEALDHYKNELEDEMNFYKFQQFMFSSQWLKLKAYANQKDIKIIGDIPIYVALDSADSWSHPELFLFDKDKQPLEVSGCPPDGFAPAGQLWGNPVYNWDYHKQTFYQWWMSRIAYSFELYDVLRVDHFRGFDEYYAIPYPSLTAENGRWKKGPGIDIFTQLNKQLGHLDIIAEDLGFITDSVVKLVEQTGYGGMKVLEFAFDSREESDYLPHNYNTNSVVYTGTHDNDTIVGWYKNLNSKDKQLANAYLDIDEADENQIHWKFIRLALASVARLAIIPIQDYLGLGSEARMNTPSTLGDNWRWRLLENEITDDLLEKIKKITTLYGR